MEKEGGKWFACYSLPLQGGTDVRDLDPQWFRRHIGTVSQEPVLFACSIRDNIAFGKATATEEEVYKLL